MTVEEHISTLTPEACRDLARNSAAIPIYRKKAADRLVEKRHPHRHHPEVAAIAALPEAAFLAPLPPEPQDEVAWNPDDTMAAGMKSLLEFQAAPDEPTDEDISPESGQGPLQASVTTKTMWSDEPADTPLVVETITSVPPPNATVLYDAASKKTRKGK